MNAKDYSEKVAPTFIEGTMVAHQIQRDELEMKDMVLVVFGDGDMYVGVCDKPRNLMRLPEDGIMGFLREAFIKAIDNEGVTVTRPKFKHIKAMYYLGQDASDQELWDLMEQARKNATGSDAECESEE